MSEDRSDLVSADRLRSYLVTGVSRGVGWAVAQRLIADGHQVYGVARGPVAYLSLAGLVQLELAEPASFAAALVPLLAELPNLDGLVHCAGIVRPGRLADPISADLAEQFSINVVAVAELTRHWLPALRAVGGTVVLVNSGSGLNARPPLAGYGATKFALRGYAEALRTEEPGIRVSTIYPGRIATEMQQTVRAAEAASYEPAAYLQPATVADVIAGVLALPPEATITDLTVRPTAQPGPSSPDQA